MLLLLVPGLLMGGGPATTITVSAVISFSEGFSYVQLMTVRFPRVQVYAPQFQQVQQQDIGFAQR